MGNDDKDKAQRVFFRGPREPFWSCPDGSCKAQRNFANRVRCQLCNGRAPLDVFKAAKAADKKAREEAECKVTDGVKDKALRELSAQVKVLLADKERRSKEAAERQMEDGGFTLSKSKAQKRKEKKAAAQSKSDGGRTSPKPCTVADILSDKDPDDNMEDAIDTISEVTTKDKLDKINKVVKGLESLCEAIPDDPELLKTLEGRKREQAEVAEAFRSETAAAKPCWKPIKEVELKRTKKRQALEKAQQHKSLLEANLDEWLRKKKEEEDAKREEIQLAEDKREQLAKEVAALDQEYAAADHRLKLGRDNTVIQDITKCLLECPAEPSHELVLAYKSAHALIKDAQNIADARIEASQASGVAIKPSEDVQSHEEAKVHATIVELSRQIHNNADNFVAAQKHLEENRAESVRHLASLQATRAAAPLAAVLPRVNPDDPPPAGDAVHAAPSGAGSGAPDAADVAVEAAAGAGQQAGALAAAAVPVPT